MESHYKHYCTKLKSLEFEITLNFSISTENEYFDGKNHVSKEEENLLQAQKQMKLAQDITVNISQELKRNKTTFSKIMDTVFLF